MTALGVLAILCSSAAAAGIAFLLHPPQRHLGPRVRPYTAAARSALGRSADARSVAAGSALVSGRTLSRVLLPLAGGLVERLSKLSDTVSEERLALRLRQSGLSSGTVVEYRVRQVLAAGAGATVIGLGAALFSLPTAGVLLAVLVGLVIGPIRERGRIDAAIERRRERMRVEIYTVTQLLSLHIRVGGGVVAALSEVAARSRGEVAGELAEVLRLHRGGRRVPDALVAVAAESPEPHAARTYRLLASGAELGTDLARALRQLGDDVRSERLETLRRVATRRRGAMLLPIIGVLAPVMLLFIAAPLPSLIFSFR